MKAIESQQVPEIFISHVGSWKGEYIKIYTKGNFRSSFIGIFTIEIQVIIYRQVNDYQYEDGSQLTLNFSG